MSEQMTIEKVVPKLRFPEFEQGWKDNKLGEIASFSKGKGISKIDIDEKGNLECIRYGELYTTYGEVIKEIFSKTNLDKNELTLSEYNDVIIPASGETEMDIATASCVLKDDVALSGDLNIIKSKVNGVFLSYYLNNTRKTDIARLSQGSSVVHLYSKQLKTLKLNLPSDEEQQKIATFLTAVDDKIQALTKKQNLLEQYKKGVMQKIFSQELRFKDENGNDFTDWEEKKIKDVFKVTRGNVLAVTKMSSFKTEKNCYPVYSSQTKKNGLTGYYDKYLYENAITWTTDGANAGEVKYRSGKFYCTNVCGVLISNEGVANSCISEMINKISRRFVSYVGNPKLMNNVMAEIKICFPSISEQAKIAIFLNSIDKKINQVNNQLDKAKQFKKGLLQQLFV